MWYTFENSVIHFRDGHGVINVFHVPIEWSRQQAERFADKVCNAFVGTQMRIAQSKKMSPC